MVRSVALFAHIVGMLVLFTGLAFEWLSLESIRRSASMAQVAPWVGVLRALPKLIAAAVGLTVGSGLYLAMRVGVLGLGWVRASLGSMILMAILGGPVVRSKMRVLLHSGANADGQAMASPPQRVASHPLLRISLRTRVVVGLTIVYLMILKPDLAESLLLISAALATGAASSLPYVLEKP
jgi:uncharacterized membrane protein